MQISQAVVEQFGKAKSYRKYINNRAANVTELRYMVTPLVAGNLAIKGVTLKGEAESTASLRRNKFMGSMFFGNVEYDPFIVVSNDLNIEILPPEIELADWLPLYNLAISDVWSADHIAVGDAISRTIKITATGVAGSQLPSLQEQTSIEHVKIYPDKPEVLQQIDATTSKILGTRQESYSIIPQVAGQLTFPEIKLEWWDLRNNIKRETTLPAKVIEVVASSNVQPQVEDYSGTTTTELAPSTPLKQEHSFSLYIVIVVLALIIISLFGIIAYLFYRLKNNKPIIRDTIEQKVKKHQPIEQPEHLRDAILEYAAENLNLGGDINLSTLITNMQSKHYVFPKDDLTAFINDLNAIIYANKQIDNVAELIERWESIKQAIVVQKKSKQLPSNSRQHKSKIKLNPT